MDEEEQKKIEEEKRFVDRYQTVQLRKDEYVLTNETDDVWLFDNKSNLN